LIVRNSANYVEVLRIERGIRISGSSSELTVEVRTGE